MKTETNRSTALREEIEALRHMTVWRLKEKYREVFGESSRSNHKQFLFRRVAGESRRTRWAASQSAHAAAHWRSPMIPTCGSARRRTF